MVAKLTNPVFISWYLAVVSILGMFTASAITVVLGHETFVEVTMAACLVCAVFFTAMAVWLRRRSRHGPGLGGLGIGYAVFALAITVMVLVFVVG